MLEDVNQIDETDRLPTLLQLLASAHSWFEDALLEAFRARGETRLGSADLKLLANLDCGTTYASELARRMKVSRQAVNKLLHNLIELDLVTLETVPHQRNTKWIVISERGRDLIGDAVAELDHLENHLAGRIGVQNAQNLRKALMADWGSAPQNRSQPD